MNSNVGAQPVTSFSNQDWIQRVQDLPTLPIVAMKVNDALNDPNASARDIAELLEKDQALMSKLLKLANSSYYAVPGGVSDVHRALSFLGFNTVAQLVLGISVFSIFDEIEGAPFNMSDFWKHTLAVAGVSQDLAKDQGYPRPAEAFTCGLLHDMGKLALFQLDQKSFLTICSTAQERIQSFTDAEQALGDSNHSALGAQVAQHWGLPPVIQKSARYHHSADTDMELMDSEEQTVVKIVRLANQLAHLAGIGHSGSFERLKECHHSLQSLGYSSSDQDRWLKRTQESFEGLGAFLNAIR